MPAALYGEISHRHSHRHYTGSPLDPAAAAALEQACRDSGPFPSARGVFINEPADAILTGIIGSYGKIRGAAAYVAFIGDASDADMQPKVGYTGEAIALEAVSLGLGTCWVGGFFKRPAVAKRVGLGPTERILAIATLGYPAIRPSASARAFVTFSQSHKRKPLKDIATFDPTEQWQRTALEAARIAPSAVNRQPWLFSLDDGAIVLSAKGGIPRFARLDCGIAMLHFELGAAHEGVHGHWEFLSPPKVGRFMLDRPCEQS